MTEDSVSENRNPFGRRKFDQIWFNDLVHIKRDDAWFSWLASMAPVRVGLLIETLDNSADEAMLMPELRTRKREAMNRCKYMTHVLACDEKDASELNQQGGVQAMWSPFPVPERAIREEEPNLQSDRAVFLGTLYGKRKDWIADPELGALLFRPKSLEDSSVYPAFFDLLRIASTNLPYLNSDLVNVAYMRMLMHVREKCYFRYLRTLASGCAVVNFPHVVKTYSPRVVEGVAVGRPVISWEIPERPLNKGLFEEGKEILLYPKDDMAQLQSQVQRVLADRIWGNQITRRALAKVKAYHTSEHRVAQVLKWIECGDVTTYS
jgi:hypothetical protein